MNSLRNSLITLSAASLTSCAAIGNLTGLPVGNPTPDLKTVHMALAHGDYTQSQLESHPDHDCHKTIYYGNPREVNAIHKLHGNAK